MWDGGRYTPIHIPCTFSSLSLIPKKGEGSFLYGNLGQGTMRCKRALSSIFPLWNLPALPQCYRRRPSRGVLSVPGCMGLCESKAQDQEALFCCTSKPHSLASALPVKNIYIFNFLSENLDLLSLAAWLGQITGMLFINHLPPLNCRALSPSQHTVQCLARSNHYYLNKQIQKYLTMEIFLSRDKVESVQILRLVITSKRILSKSPNMSSIFFFQLRSCYREIYDPQTCKHLLSGPLQIKLADPFSKGCHEDFRSDVIYCKGLAY